jgi:ABC-type antimicrobial peptide transport system permease subunit
VAGLVLRDGALMAGVGVVCGLVASAGLSPFVADRLFRVSPFDPATLIAVSAALFLTAVLAAYLPARRATRLDPVRSLRPQ